MLQQFLFSRCFSFMKDIQIDTLGFFVDRVFSYMVKSLNKKLNEECFDIQQPQFAILMVMSKKDGLDQSTISEYVNRDKASVSRNIKSLVEKGYLNVKPYGGKKNKIFLSDKGKELIPTLYEIGRYNTLTTLKGFSEKKRGNIFKVLDKMYRNVSSVVEN